MCRLLLHFAQFESRRLYLFLRVEDGQRVLVVRSRRDVFLDPPEGIILGVGSVIVRSSVLGLAAVGKDSHSVLHPLVSVRQKGVEVLVVRIILCACQKIKLWSQNNKFHYLYTTYRRCQVEAGRHIFCCCSTESTTT